MAEYPINKGIGRSVEFKGLKAQYLFIFVGGLLALFVLFVILYMVGTDQWICIGIGVTGASVLVWQTFALNARNGVYGLMKQGVILRHLVLPGYLDNTRQVLDWIAETFAPGDVAMSLMSQYTPPAGMTGRLARRVTAAEYRAAVTYMRNCGIEDGFVQERTSAEDAYTPAFDGTGV